MDIPLIFLPRHASFHFFASIIQSPYLEKNKSLQGEQKEYEHGTDSQTTT